MIYRQPKGYEDDTQTATADVLRRAFRRRICATTKRVEQYSPIGGKAGSKRLLQF